MTKKTYTKKQFLADVAAEAKALKNHATKEELERLNVKCMNPEFPSTCIYGQMTGNCRSERATELIELCCKRFFVNDYCSARLADGFEAIQKRVNGEKLDNIKLDRAQLNHFSSIETYILTPENKSGELIAFLRDERKDLVL
jgi:hypothetical protein